MKNFDLQEEHFQFSDPIESYLECISTFDIKIDHFISKFLEIFKQYDN